MIGGYRSDYVNILSGVPQGSIIGPLLYSCYLYDIKSSFKFARFLMYADDTKVYIKVRNTRGYDCLQEDLNCLSAYYNRNIISLNVNKCSDFYSKEEPY